MDDYKTKVEKALVLAADLEQLGYIEDKIMTTPKINRRTKQGRELTQELLWKANERKQQLSKIISPF